jgi:hypothetical protein
MELKERLGNYVLKKIMLKPCQFIKNSGESNFQLDNLLAIQVIVHLNQYFRY